jgi:hypothetical protein
MQRAGAEMRSRRRTRAPLLHGVEWKADDLNGLKVFARLEAHRFPGWNTHFFAGSRIAANARLARPDVEHAKTAQLDPVAFCQGILHGLKYGFHGNLGLGLGESSAVNNLVHDIVFNHADLLEKKEVLS